MTSSIPDWYNGKRIFVTGGTGFMGKVLVEKLLRSCSEVSAIYLLVRTKRGKSPEERLEDFVNVPVRYLRKFYLKKSLFNVNSFTDFRQTKRQYRKMAFAPIKIEMHKRRHFQESFKSFSRR